MELSDTLIASKHGILYGTTRSGKTYKISELIQQIPNIVIFVNTQFELRPEQYSEIVVRNNVELINALENGYKKICINYQMDWSNRDTNLNNVDQMIQLMFKIAETNLHNFKLTIIIDELDGYVTQHVCSPSIDHLFNRGLRFGINAIGIGHLPAGIHTKVKGACSWFIYFEQSDEAKKYFSSKSSFVAEHLKTAKYGNYEGYYREKDKFWLFCQRSEIREQETNGKQDVHTEQMSERDKMDNTDITRESELLDSNV